ncbi:ribonuclease H-like domain-containing protein, partial [Tanacetum coccineum]
MHQYIGSHMVPNNFQRYGPTGQPTTPKPTRQSFPTANPTSDKPEPGFSSSMVTCFCVGSNRPPEHLNLHVSTLSPLPKSYIDAFNNPNLQNSMRDEYNALIKNNTWTRVPRPTDANIVRYMWMFQYKDLANGTLSRYKALLVANESTQGTDISYLLLYVDDIVLTVSSE